MAETDTSPAALRALADYWASEKPAGVDPNKPGTLDAVFEETGAKMAETIAALQSLAGQKEALNSTLRFVWGAEIGDLVAKLADAEMRLAALAAEKEAGAPAPDGWIPWEGGACPVPSRTVVDVRYRSGGEDRDVAVAWDWSHGLGRADIIAYRLSKEGMTVTADGWIKWKGGECPVAKDTLVYVRLRNGSPLAGPYRAETVTWSHDDTFRSFDIIAYRIVKEG